MTDIKTMMQVFQVCDSTFPIGTFNHSFGMENYLFERKIKKAPQFKMWIESYFHSQYRYGEGLLTLLCHDASLEDILTYDDIITQSTLAKETREGTKMIARQMYILIQKMYGDTFSLLNSYVAKIENEQAYGNPAIIFSLFAYALGLSPQEVFTMYGYSIVSTLVQNGVRSIPLGQREGQVILHELITLIDKLYHEVATYDEELLGANAPGLELAQIRHEVQAARLFMS
ncbi:urease accessory protein UreF [Sharpea azabuensis]|uniref:Urease accessory protein UreF n=1 Tax=Sharpea porci TaxID=2652286 RepID=A0A844FTD2_9FIRM|nr:urease accessory UreF family protein [Sharpea porci]MST89281.1 urease accessory protein UreF [Sharpea porci]